VRTGAQSHSRPVFIHFANFGAGGTPGLGSGQGGGGAAELGVSQARNTSVRWSGMLLSALKEFFGRLGAAICGWQTLRGTCYLLFPMYNTLESGPQFQEWNSSVVELSETKIATG